MVDNKNLVKEHLLKNKIIDSNKFIHSYFYEDVEWFIYKLSDNTLKYVSYELTSDGIGYAFCVDIKCNCFKYEIEPIFYSKSFTNNSSGEWKDISDDLKDKLLAESMEYLQIWKKS